MVVPWIVAGPGVRQGVTLTWPISSTDAAPTLLHTIGVRPPLQMHGRVVDRSDECEVHLERDIRNFDLKADRRRHVYILERARSNLTIQLVCFEIY